MILENSTIHFLYGILSDFSFLISFLSPILGGENAVIFVAFLSSQGFLSLWIVFFFSFLGMMAIDSIWFFITKTKYFKKLKNWKKISKKYLQVEEHIQKITRNKDVLLLLIAKILIGTRILIIIYLSSKKVSFKKFIFYNSIPTLIWAGLLCFIGYLAGKGFTSIIEVFKNVQIAIIFLFIFFIFFYVLIRRLNAWVMKRKKKLI
jgi:membrane protein DedA with SNARE-associated domain